jgi:uncharacterized coiled-coil protein SlyX
MKGKHHMKTHQLGGNMSDDTRIALLEQSIGHINQTLIRIEQKVDKLDDKVDKVSDNVDKKVDEARSLAWSQFRWIMGALISIFAAVALKGYMG